MATNLLLAAAGVLLLYAAPGIGVSAAVFPEKFRPNSDRWLAAVELAVLGVVLSVAITILWGELLQTVGPGFSASWSNPTLLIADGGTALAGLVVGAFRGAFGGHLLQPTPASGSPGENAAWPTLRQLERLSREERTLTRTLARPGIRAEEREAATGRLESVRLEREALRRARETEYAA